VVTFDSVAGTVDLLHLLSEQEVTVTTVVCLSVTVSVAGTVISVHLLSEQEVMVTTSVLVLVTVPVAGTVISVHLLSEQEVMVTTSVLVLVTVAGTVISEHLLSEQEVMVTTSVLVLVVVPVEVDSVAEPVDEEPEGAELVGTAKATSKTGAALPVTGVPSLDFKDSAKSEASSLLI